EQISALRDYRSLINITVEYIAKGPFDEVLQNRLRMIAEPSLKFVDGVIARQRATRDELLQFTHEMGPRSDELAAESARLQLDALHAQVMEWRRQVDVEDWKRLRVIVMGSAEPRQGNIAIQYFAKLLGVPGECERLVYAEGLFDEPKALALLGTRVID